MHLTGWNDIESRLERDASWRFQGLERTIGREWASLRLLHEEPARQLREQAESLTEICVNKSPNDEPMMHASTTVYARAIWLRRLYIPI